MEIFSRNCNSCVKENDCSSELSGNRNVNSRNNVGNFQGEFRGNCNESRTGPIKCFECGGMGHIARNCFSHRTNRSFGDSCNDNDISRSNTGCDWRRCFPGNAGNDNSRLSNGFDQCRSDTRVPEGRRSDPPYSFCDLTA